MVKPVAKAESSDEDETLITKYHLDRKNRHFDLQKTIVKEIDLARD